MNRTRGLSNAIKFTPPGNSVTLTTTAAGGGIEIAVSDTGLPLAKAFAEESCMAAG